MTAPRRQRQVGQQLDCAADLNRGAIRFSPLKNPGSDVRGGICKGREVRSGRRGKRQLERRKIGGRIIRAQIRPGGSEITCGVRSIQVKQMGEALIVVAVIR